ncbi:hypothetical protein D3C80_1504260 [compost metagenome]
MNPTSMAATITATEKPAMMYSPSISKKFSFFGVWCSSPSASALASVTVLSGSYGLIRDSTIKVLNMLSTSAATT